jgi:hypothetical protein
MFKSDNYKGIIKDSLLHKKSKIGKPYTFQALAQVCKMQKTHLSKILLHDGHLTSDQVYRAAEFLGFTKLERDYLMTLYEYDRTEVQGRRQELESILQNMKKTFRKTETHVNFEQLNLSPQDHHDYYLDPLMQITHMLLTIDFYQKNTSQIETILRLSKERFAAILSKLERLGIIEFKGNRYKAVKIDMHLSAESPVYPAYTKLMRLKSLEQCDTLASDKKYNFTATFAADEATRRAVHAAFLDFLGKAHELATNAPSEKIFQMNFDLFQWV